MQNLALGSLHRVANKLANATLAVRDKTEELNLKVHLHWRKTLARPTRTIDEEFEALAEELEAIQNASREIFDLLLHFLATLREVFSSSQRVVNTIHLLCFSAVGSAAVSDPSHTLDSWRHVKRYTSVLQEIQLCLDDSAESLAQNLHTKLDQLMLHLASIYKHVLARDQALGNYDRMYDKYDALKILSATSDFTPNQNYHYDILERKLELLKASYDEHNTSLKLELPHFFMLVREFIEPLTLFVFYVHLTASYQLTSNLLTLASDYGVLSSVYRQTFNLEHMAQFLRSCTVMSDMSQALRSDQGKGPSAPEESTADFITALETPPRTTCPIGGTGRLCLALFRFDSLEEGDLLFNKGDVIELLDTEGEWWIGLLRGKQGLFPAVYVELI